MIKMILSKNCLSLIVRVNVVLNRTVVVDGDWRFDNLCGSHLQSQSELYRVSWWYYTLVIGLIIGQLRRDVIGRLSVKSWCYWIWRLVISNSIWNQGEHAVKRSCLYGWLRFRFFIFIPQTKKEYGIINSTTGKYCSVAFIWMVTL